MDIEINKYELEFKKYVNEVNKHRLANLEDKLNILKKAVNETEKEIFKLKKFSEEDCFNYYSKTMNDYIFPFHTFLKEEIKRREELTKLGIK